MDFKLLIFLSFFNWKMFSKISVTFGDKKGFSIPRLFLILPLIIFLAYEAYTVGFVVRILMIFVLSMLIIEMARVSNKCFYDPIHLFFLNVSFKNKFLGIWISEYFGIKFLLYIIFNWIGIMDGNSIILVVLLLFFTYSVIITLQVSLSIIGNRIKLVSLIYQWTLVVVFSFLIASLGIFTEGMNFIPITTKIENLRNMHSGTTVLVGVIILISLFYLSFLTVKEVYKGIPFINKDSFPKKMI